MQYANNETKTDDVNFTCQYVKLQAWFAKFSNEQTDDVNFTCQYVKLQAWFAKFSNEQTSNKQTNKKEHYFPF